MTYNKNNTESRYGNLLDKYMKLESNYVSTYAQKKKQEEQMCERYGGLLDNVKSPEHKIYETLIKLEDANVERKRKEAEEEEQKQLRIRERREREVRELQERKDRNDAIINNMLEKKKAEQEAYEKRKQEEAEHQKNLDRVAWLVNNVSERAALAYAQWIK